MHFSGLSSKAHVSHTFDFTLLLPNSWCATRGDSHNIQARRSAIAGSLMTGSLTKRGFWSNSSVPAASVHAKTQYKQVGVEISDNFVQKEPNSEWRRPPGPYSTSRA